MSSKWPVFVRSYRWLQRVSPSFPDKSLGEDKEPIRSQVADNIPGVIRILKDLRALSHVPAVVGQGIDDTGTEPYTLDIAIAPAELLKSTAPAELPVCFTHAEEIGHITEDVSIPQLGVLEL